MQLSRRTTSGLCLPAGRRMLLKASNKVAFAIEFVTCVRCRRRRLRLAKRKVSNTNGKIKIRIIIAFAWQASAGDASKCSRETTPNDSIHNHLLPYIEEIAGQQQHKRSGRVAIVAKKAKGRAIDPREKIKEVRCGPRIGMTLPGWSVGTQRERILTG